MSVGEVEADTISLIDAFCEENTERTAFVVRAEVDVKRLNLVRKEHSYSSDSTYIRAEGGM